MNRIVLPALLLVALVLAAPASATTPKQFRAQIATQKAKVAALKKQLAATKAADAATIAGLNGQITTLTTQVATVNGQLSAANTASGTTIAGLNSTIAAQTAQITAQAQGGLAAVLAGNPTDLWNAVISIWQVFPMLPPSGFCGLRQAQQLLRRHGPQHRDIHVRRRHELLTHRHPGSGSARRGLTPRGRV